jgi:hypothetical protein
MPDPSADPAKQAEEIKVSTAQTQKSVASLKSALEALKKAKTSAQTAKKELGSEDDE